MGNSSMPAKTPHDSTNLPDDFDKKDGEDNGEKSEGTSDTMMPADIGTSSRDHQNKSETVEADDVQIEVIGMLDGDFDLNQFIVYHGNTST